MVLGAADLIVDDARTFVTSIGLEIAGSNDFRADAQDLVSEFRDIFSKELSPEPADLPPLDVPINTAKWHQPKQESRSCAQPNC